MELIIRDKKPECCGLAMTPVSDRIKNGYSIDYYCQSGEEKDVRSLLTPEEKSQLTRIIIKLLDNGVKLRVEYTPLTDILERNKELINRLNADK